MQGRVLRVFIKSVQHMEPRDRSIARARLLMDLRMSCCYRISPGVRLRRVLAGDVPGELIDPPNSRSGRTLYYIHGGGFHMGSCRSHRGFVARLAATLGMRAFHVDYRLIPEHPFPAAVEDCSHAYRWLVEHGAKGDEVLLAGESVGGGLALTTMFQARDAGLPLPVGAVCMSPVTDGTLEGRSYLSHARRDPLVTRDYARWIVSHYACGSDLRLPLLSPLYGDFRGLPPLLIVVGGDEVLLEDSTRLAARARAAGVDVSLGIWPGMWHAFPLTRFLPEARQAIEEIRAFASSLTPTGQRRALASLS